MGLAIVLGIVVLLAIFVVSNYNGLVRLREMVRNAMGQISAQIESRWDAVSNLIEATKQYSSHEAEVLRDITASRSGINKDSSAREVEQDDAKFDSVMRQINVVAEAYPDLKASEVYTNTMNSVNKYEENVRMSRMVYNDTVTKLNSKIQMFPTNIIASMFGFTKEEYFKSSSQKANMPSWS